MPKEQSYDRIIEKLQIPGFSLEKRNDEMLTAAKLMCNVLNDDEAKPTVRGVFAGGHWREIQIKGGAAYDAGRENQKLQRTGICRILH